MHAHVPNVGEPAPDVDITTPDGVACRLTDYRGSAVVIAFHAKHWDPARDETSSSGVATVLGDDRAASVYGVRDTDALFAVDASGVIQSRYTATGGVVAAPADNTWTRREFVATALGAAFLLALEPLLVRRQTAAAAPAIPGVGDPRPVTLNVNGHDLTLTLEPRVTLLDALREYAGLTGSKKGCDHGQCGACTVHVDGRRVLSCLTFAVMQHGKKISTIEGLATGETLHPMQQAFIKHDGFQCGYCTSGQIMSATAMVREPWGKSDDDVREAMSGNICRCGAYPGIVAAIQDVRGGGTQ